jgi:hypothetical protein
VLLLVYPSRTRGTLSVLKTDDDGGACYPRAPRLRQPDGASAGLSRAASGATLGL